MIARYWTRLAALVRPGRAAALSVAADAEGLRIGGVRVPWHEVRRLDAYKRDVYAADLLCLAILASGDRVYEIDEESPGWNEAGDAIERFLPGSLPRAEWGLRLIAARPGAAVAVFSGTGPGPAR